MTPRDKAISIVQFNVKPVTFCYMTTSPSLLFIRQNTVMEIVIGYSDDEQMTTHCP
jgi:hypothetical protein